MFIGHFAKRILQVCDSIKVWILALYFRAQEWKLFEMWNDSHFTVIYDFLWNSLFPSQEVQRPDGSGHTTGFHIAYANFVYCNGCWDLRPGNLKANWELIWVSHPNGLHRCEGLFVCKRKIKALTCFYRDTRSVGICDTVKHYFLSRFNVAIVQGTSWTPRRQTWLTSSPISF